MPVLLAGPVCQQKARLIPLPGYDPGTVDGIFDGKTIEALQGFQRDEKLTETGLPDQPTLVRLLLQ